MRTSKRIAVDPDCQAACQRWWRPAEASMPWVAAPSSGLGAPSRKPGRSSCELGEPGKKPERSSSGLGAPGKKPGRPSSGFGAPSKKLRDPGSNRGKPSRKTQRSSSEPGMSGKSPECRADSSSDRTRIGDWRLSAAASAGMNRQATIDSRHHRLKPQDVEVSGCRCTRSCRSIPGFGLYATITDRPITDSSIAAQTTPESSGAR